MLKKMQVHRKSQDNAPDDIFPMLDTFYATVKRMVEEVNKDTDHRELTIIHADKGRMCRVTMPVNGDEPEIVLPAGFFLWYVKEEYLAAQKALANRIRAIEHKNLPQG